MRLYRFIKSSRRRLSATGCRPCVLPARMFMYIYLDMYFYRRKGMAELFFVAVKRQQLCLYNLTL